MKKQRTKKRWVIPSLILAALLLCSALYSSNRTFSTEYYTVSSDHIPDSFDGFRIVQLSDVHGAVFGDGNLALLEAVKEAKPDIIAVTGDLIDSGDTAQWETMCSLMKKLVSVAPTYYVTGNHEWAVSGTRDFLALMEEAGVTVLRNKWVALTSPEGETVILAGTDDPNGPADMKTPEELIEEIRAQYPESCLILLNHRNDWFKRHPDSDVDLVISGHAHGGMIRLPFTDGLVGPSRELFPSYTNGLYEENGTTLFVSRGLGNGTSFPRLFNPPHLPVITLEKS